MQRSAPRSARRTSAAPVLSVMGLVLGALTALPAQAAPPTAEDFQITYFITDENGDRSRRMQPQDMQQFVGQARCQCEQKIIARINLLANSVDAEQLQTFVGQQCATAQATMGISQFAPCAQLVAGLPQLFQNGPEYVFEPIWLAYGADAEQSISSAVPAGGCDSQESSSGIWMCSGVNNCNTGQFFINGDVNINTQNTDTPQGINFDYIPPVTPPTNFSAEAGDSAVVINWENLATADVAGYRVLCADADGEPINNGVSKPAPNVDDIVLGQVYFTRDNLCPGGPFGEDYDPDGDGWGTSDTGGDETDTGTDETDSGTDETDSGTDETDSGTDTSCDPGTLDCDCLDGTTCDDGLQCIEGICIEEGCTPGEAGCACADGTDCEDGFECSGGLCLQPQSGIMSLRWDYVCSEHLANTSTSARVEGLENGKSYQFLVVAYDAYGNPVYPDTPLEATPVPTNGLWEECENQPGVCGEGWNCSVVEAPGSRSGWLLGLFGLAGLAGLGLRRRRRA